MLEARWVRWLSRLLPERGRRELFEPSYFDLRAEYLDAQRQGHSAARDLWHGFRICLLIAECWFVILPEIARAGAESPEDVPVRKLPLKERFVMFLYLVRHAFRLLVREPAFTLAAVLTLALGVGANVAVFAVVEAVLLRPFPYPDAGRLVILNHRDRRTGITKEFLAIGDYLDMVQRQTSFESLGAYGYGQATVFGVGDPFRVSVLQAGPTLLDTLGAHVSLGRGLKPEDSRPSAPPGDRAGIRILADPLRLRSADHRPWRKDGAGGTPGDRRRTSRVSLPAE